MRDGARDGHHFSPELFRFLRDLKRHNDRTWFAANKVRYERDAQQPALRFVADLGRELRKISSHIVADPKPVGGSVMRIYRDIRFSRDKSPYKTAIAMHFPIERGGGKMGPAFYLHLEPDRSSIGGGMWRPEPADLRKIRDAIVEDHAGWRRAIERVTAKGFRVVGTSLKRVPRGYDTDHPAAEDLKRIDFTISKPLSDSAVGRDRFYKVAATACRDATPLVRFLSEALGLKW